MNLLPPRRDLFLDLKPGTRFEQMMEQAMPDYETQMLARQFFSLGKQYIGTRNAVGVMIAAMQECLGTWAAHLTGKPDRGARGKGDNQVGPSGTRPAIQRVERGVRYAEKCVLAF